MAREPIIAAIISLCVAVCVGCTVQVETPPSKRPEPGGDTDHVQAPPKDPKPTNLERDRRIAAMMSVRAHTVLDDHVLATLDILPLTDAAKLLIEDKGARADSRRLRATATLAAHRFAEQAPVDSAERLEQINAALAILQMDEERLKKLEAELAKEYPFVVGTALDINIPWIKMLFTILMPNLFDSLFADLIAGPCQWQPELPDAWVSKPGVWPVILKTKVSVNIPLADVAQNIDPQRWDDCSAFWEPPPDATRIVDWVGGKAVAASSPPLAGTHHPARMLMEENFSCGTLCGNADFELLLCVGTECDPTPATGTVDCTGGKEFRVTYDLPRGGDGNCSCTAIKCPPPCSLQNTKWWLTNSAIGSVQATPCIDEGHINAEEDPSDPSRTIVDAEKILHFDPGYLTTELAITLSLFLDEMNDELGELACCLN